MRYCGHSHVADVRPLRVADRPPRPQHNPVIGGGWIKRGEDDPIKRNTGRRRLNIDGAINVQTLSAAIRFDDTIAAAATLALFRQIEQTNPTASPIVVLCDKAEMTAPRRWVST